MNLTWQPSATREILHARAELLKQIRNFFAEHGVCEVETPLLSRATVTDPALASLQTRVNLPNIKDINLYLQTSPEFAMKRLLAAGSGSIYQISKAFRDGECGRWHHPEFSLLEWYRPGWNYHQLMDEVASLLRIVLQQPDLPAERISYYQLFQNYFMLDPWTASPEELRDIALKSGIKFSAGCEFTRTEWLDLLLTHELEPKLGQDKITFIYDYLPTQAALAQVRAGPPAVAERFEVYLAGIEIANGFQELTDSNEQRTRFLADLALRRQKNLFEPPLDENLLAALEYGLPECSGVAIGIDRLLMIICNKSNLAEILTFPIEIS